MIRYAAMDLWLVRHGEAVPENVDPSRPLSAEGFRWISEVASVLACRIGNIDLVAASGKLRARQTAQILAASAGYPSDRIAETSALSPGASPEAFLEFLEEQKGNGTILCAGHLPSIAHIASCLLSAGDPVRLVFNPGTACLIRLSSIRRGAGELVFLY